MKDEQKTRAQLVAELQSLRRQMVRQESLPTGSEQGKKTRWKSEDILQLVMDNIPQAVFWKDRNSKYMGCNQVFANDIGFAAPHDVIGKSDYDLSCSAEKADYFQKTDQLIMNSAQAVYHAIECVIKSDESFSWQDISKIPLFNDNGAVIGLLVTYQDITERMEAEQALQVSLRKVAEQKAFLQSIFKSAPVGINLAMNRKFYWINEKFSDITGYSSEELIGRSARMLYLSDEEFERVGRKIYPTIKECGTGSADTRWQRKDGTILDIALCATTANMDDLANGVTFTSLDITQRKQAEKALAEYKEELEQRVAERTEALKKTHQQLVHVEKLSAIGRLSSSIAHEFNNPLNGIQSVLEGVHESGRLEQEDVNMVAMALAECNRVRRLIRNLLNFNAPSTDTREVFNMHETLDAILSMCCKELSSCSIKVCIEYGDNLPDIQAVPDQIKQVLLNLITNAKDAMQENGGLLTLETGQEDQQVVVRISDTGSGIDPKDLGQVFEPFFTTKSAFKGTGLGLSVSYGIVRGHDGDIEVESALGKGSTFSLYLPIGERQCHDKS